jgi:hypothetical protein
MLLKHRKQSGGRCHQEEHSTLQEVAGPVAGPAVTIALAAKVHVLEWTDDVERRDREQLALPLLLASK